MADLEFAHAVLVLDCDPIADAPILDLRLRKGVRRHGMKLVRADRGQLLDEAERETLLDALRAAGEEVVVLWHERLAAGPDGERAVRALLDLAATLGLAGIDGAGLLEVPAHANGRGLREAGVLPNAGPGLTDVDEDTLGGAPHDGGHARRRAGRTGDRRRVRARRAELPLFARRRSAARAGSGTIIAHAAFLTDGVARTGQRRAPRGGIPREGRHRHTSRRHRPARAPRRAPHRRDARRAAGYWSNVAERIGLGPDVNT